MGTTSIVYGLIKLGNFVIPATSIINTVLCPLSTTTNVRYVYVHVYFTCISLSMNDMIRGLDCTKAEALVNPGTG